MIDKYREYGIRLKAHAFARYKTMIRRPVLEHKYRTYEKIFRVNPSERTNAVVQDLTEQDEEEIQEELEQIAPENDISDAHKMLEIERGY